MDILQLINELEDVLDEAGNVPFSKKVTVDPDDISEIIKEIRGSLPEEIRQAKWVNDEKDRILSEAQEQANQILEDAKRRAKEAESDVQRKYEELVSEHHITKVAIQHGEEIVAEAEKNAQTIRQGIFAYVDEILENTQKSLQNVIVELDNNRQELR